MDGRMGHGVLPLLRFAGVAADRPHVDTEAGTGASDAQVPEPSPRTRRVFDADPTGKTEGPSAVTLGTQQWEEPGAAVSVWLRGAEKAWWVERTPFAESGEEF